jgi:hypothetical protein
MNTWIQQCLAKAAAFWKPMSGTVRETEQRNTMKKYSHYSQRTFMYAIAAAGMAIGVSLLTVLAQSQPVLTIAPMGTNQFQVNITNAVPGAAYELWWVPALNDPLCPWSLIQTNGPGQTNFGVDCGQWGAGFFRASVSQNYGGIWDYQLANPNDPSLGALAITIDSPTNGMVLQ